MANKFLDETGLTKLIQLIKSALNNKQNSLTLPLSTSNGGTGNANGNAPTATKLQTGRTFKVNLTSTNASTIFDGSANITDIGVSGTLPVANGGTGANNLSNITVGSATKLQTGRTLKVNLASSTSSTFDGSADINIGVTGTLSAANGGTGATNLANVTVGNATNATNATTASKLGTSTVGATNRICYLNGGTPTAGITISYGTSLPTTGNDGDIFILIS